MSVACAVCIVREIISQCVDVVGSAQFVFLHFARAMREPNESLGQTKERSRSDRKSHTASNSNSTYAKRANRMALVEGVSCISIHSGELIRVDRWVSTLTRSWHS